MILEVSILYVISSVMRMITGHSRQDAAWDDVPELLSNGVGECCGGHENESPRKVLPHMAAETAGAHMRHD